MTPAKHGLFQLMIQQYGLDACTAEPSQMSTFLLLISEAIANGFWAEANQQTT